MNISHLQEIEIVRKGSMERKIECEKKGHNRQFGLVVLSRIIAHLVPISIVPSGLDKYPTSISVIPAFHVFHFEVPGSNPERDQPASNITMICS